MGPGLLLSLLGPEETQHHAALTMLQQATLGAVAGIMSGSSSSAPSSTALAGLDRQIQGQLATMRGHIRDLELLAEEQDT